MSVEATDPVAAAELLMHRFGESECSWIWTPMRAVAFGKRETTQHNWLTTINPVPSTDPGPLTSKIHSRQFLRGMHINRF